MHNRRPVVRFFSGQLVIDDPNAVAVVNAIAKVDCGRTLALNSDRVAHFKMRHFQLGKTAEDTVIVIINVDDVRGGPIADILMPHTDWQPIRDAGQVPFARGLASRQFMQNVIGAFDQEAAKKLREQTVVSVVVVDHGVAEVYSA